MDPLWIIFAFGFGFLSQRLRLPPLVGFLVAGFVLRAAGVEGGPVLAEIAEIGLLLLLFGIGLKLRLRALARPEIWGVASLHAAITTLAMGGGAFALGVASVAAFAGLDAPRALLVGFALSFSSTVFAVKVLEEKGEMSSLHARVAIGILVMQDIFAVVFLTFSLGKIPSPWALALLGLPLLRPPLAALVARFGHGEMLAMGGLLVAVGGAALFELVGMKPDLGALVAGVLLSGHPKANELSKALLGLKDLLLVGFFLEIGIEATPSLGAGLIALLLVVLVPLKSALFFGLLCRFHLRARTSTLTSLSLANYSEFGLIVASVGAANGWLSGEWLAIIAIAVSISFVGASSIAGIAHDLYSRYADRLRGYETSRRIPGDELLDLGSAEIAIFGMGRVGTQAYDLMRERYGDVVIGIDTNDATARRHRDEGRNVIVGDATDEDFWERAPAEASVRVVMLTLSSQRENLWVAKRVAALEDGLLVAATASFDDHVAELEAAGVDAAFDLQAQAGLGFAERVCEQLLATGTSK